MTEANNLPADTESMSIAEDSDALAVSDIPDADTTDSTDTPEEIDGYTFADLNEPAVDATIATQRFNALHAQHDAQLRVVVYRHIPPDLIASGLAESVMSDVYTALYDRLLMAPMHENPGAWLTMVAKRKIVDQLRRHTLRAKNEIYDYVADGENESFLEQQLGRAAVTKYSSLSGSEELTELVATLLSAITKEQRDLLISRHIQEKDMPEIVAWLSEKEQRPITPVNARTRLTRARHAAAKAYSELLVQRGLPEQTHFTRFFATLEEVRKQD